MARRFARPRRLSCENLEDRRLLAAAPVISEFLALNNGSLLDGRGRNSDWIEIFNAGDQAADLDGWYLTDDEQLLQKWRFPSTTLPPGERILVFASGDDAADPLGNLHTNFELSGDGEYLAMVRPDGVTVVSEFRDVPAQRGDVAYGIEEAASYATLVDRNTSGRLLVPSAADDAQIGSQWRGGTEPFDDGGWQPVDLAVGYDDFEPTRVFTNVALGKFARQSTDGFNLPAGLAVDGNRAGNSISHTATGDLQPWWEVDLAEDYLLERVVVYTRDNCCTPASPERDYNLRVEVRDSADAVLYTSDVFNPWNGVGGAATTVGPGASFTVDLSDEPDGGVSGRKIRVTKQAFGGSSHSEWLHLAEIEAFAWTLDEQAEENLALNKPTTGDVAFGRPTGLAVDGSLDSFTHSDTVGPVFWQLDLQEPTRIGRIELVNRADGCCPERLNGAVLTVMNENLETLYVGETIAAAGVGETLVYDNEGFGFRDARFIRVDQADQYLSIAELRVFPPQRYNALIATDIEQPMRDQNASAYLRLPFDVEEASVFDRLTLSAYFDDGFVAYLNGMEIARENAPAGSPAFDAQATAEHVGTLRSDFPIDPALLRDGENMLAIHGLNLSLSDADFLLLPELTARFAHSGDVGYLVSPTPGTENGVVVVGFIQDTKFNVDRGFFDEPFDVQITTDTPGATIIYTIDGTEPSWEDGVQVPSGGPDQPPLVTVPISTTTVLRAAAFKTDYQPTNADTQTYIFLQDVIRQPANPAGFPSVWDGVGQNPIPADYEMDPEVVNSPLYRDEILQGLRDIPTISLVMNPEDLFGEERGIYINSGQRGSAWEHKTSVEIIEPDGGAFQVDSGVRIHGFSWRFHSNTPKHSFRLEFRDEYGPSKLEYPLFPDAPVDRFDSIVLRAQGGRAWAGRQVPQESQYLRDTFARDTARDMGKVDGHAALVHLYINGLYWGLYNPVERPDAQMGEEYFGGNQDDYDALNRRTTTNEAIDGDLVRYYEMLALADAGLTTPEAYQEMQRYVDIDNLIDFFLIHQYTTNRDGPETFQSNNQRAIGSRVGDPLFRFFVWDMEYSMWSPFDNININVDVPTSASHVFTKLRENAEFRLRYADRAHRHLFNDGALTPQQSANRWDVRARQIERAIISESARWGDAKRSTPYTRDVEWEAERSRLMNQYFPQRTGVLIGQLRAAGLYPNLAAPAFNQHGGQAALGFELTMAAPAGTVYYTLDGSDPRLPGGAVAPGAMSYTEPLPLTSSGLVKARVFDGAVWSALNAAEFFLNVPASAENLAISEVHYHPPGPTPAELALNNAWTDNDFEFVELRNISQQSVDLSGARFTEGFSFEFSSATATVAPGQHVVVVRNQEAFGARYGTAAVVAGQFLQGGLSDGGEGIELLDRFGGVIRQFEYNDSGVWPGRADGNGSSLEIVDPRGDYDDGDNWRSSAEYGGSPGADGAGPVAGVVINEVLSHTDPPQSDAVELFNPTAADIDVSGWYLSDSSNNYRKYKFLAGTMLPAGGYLVLDESDLNPMGGLEETDFSFNGAHGDDVWLLEADADDRLIRFVDHVEFGAQANAESWGRWPNGQGELYPLSSLTLAAANAAPRVGPIVISEIMYHAPDPADGSSVGAEDLEYVEIYNPTAENIDLSGWRLDNGVAYDFPPGETIAPQEAILITSFDPHDLANQQLAAAFDEVYGLPAEVHWLGGFSGRLANAGDSIVLLQPDLPPLDEPDFTPQLQVDRLDYEDDSPWPARADGAGFSLTRVDAGQWSGEPRNWMAVAPTPGSIDLSPAHPLLVELNTDQVDPLDLPSGAQATSWERQRAYLGSIQIVFSQVMDLSWEDLELTNMGLDADADPDLMVSLLSSQLTVNGNVVTLSFGPQRLADGVYSLRVLPTAQDRSGNPLDGDGDGVGGDAFVYRGNAENRLYQLGADFNGDGGVSIFDFPVFAYWFGQATVSTGGSAPEYADLNLDGGVTIFDFPAFAANFGGSVTFPVAAQGLPASPLLFPSTETITRLRPFADQRPRTPRLEARAGSAAGGGLASWNFIPGVRERRSLEDSRPSSVAAGTQALHDLSWREHDLEELIQLIAAEFRPSCRR